MAKVTITFEDKSKNGLEGVEFEVKCDPEVDPTQPNVVCTPAMQIGVGISKMWDTGELAFRCEKAFEKLKRED